VGEVLDDEEGVMQRNVMAESIVLVKYAPISVSGEAIHCVDQSSIRRFLTLAKCLELLVTSILFRQRACAAMSKSGRSNVKPLSSCSDFKVPARRAASSSNGTIKMRERNPSTEVLSFGDFLLATP